MTPAQIEALRIAGYALRQVLQTGEFVPGSLAAALTKALEEIDEALPVGTLREEPIMLQLPWIGATKAPNASGCHPARELVDMPGEAPPVVAYASAAEISTARAIVAALGDCAGIPCTDCPDFCTGLGYVKDAKDCDAQTLERAKAWLENRRG